MALRYRRLSLRLGLIIILCVPTLFIFLLGWRQAVQHHLENGRLVGAEPVGWSGPKCLGWKATFGCIPLGPRLPAADRTCTQETGGESGYCLCEGNITVARMFCGPHRFRCQDECAKLGHSMADAQPLPKPLVCGLADRYDLAELLPAWVASRSSATASVRKLGSVEPSGAARGDSSGGGAFAAERGPRSWDAEGSDSGGLSPSSSWVWDEVDDVMHQHGPGIGVIPGPRIDNVDWVLEGRRMKRAQVDRLAAAVAGLLRDLPPYPDANAMAAAGMAAGEGDAGGATFSGNWSALGKSSAVFSGRGVVMVGGGMHYLTPAWVNLHLLRRTGCTLPVELWFPVEEFPTPAVEAALQDLGVTSRRLSARDLPQTGYGVKVAALLLSSFQEVLLLDSDNGVLRDPTYLFESEPYISTGALLWPDYWDRTAAPEITRILNIPASQMPSGTFESGQMVIDKARHWRGLLVAAYMNFYGSTFSELLSCYIGKGDKETFAYGMLAAGEPMWVSPVKPGSAGVVSELCSPVPDRVQSCREQYLGNTMVQYGPDGGILFFHANYHKWDLALPDSFEHGWNRRWQVLQPSGRDVAEVIYGNTGYDVEHFVYRVLRGFRCASWFESYHAARVSVGEAALPSLDGFHPLPDFITFRDFYRKGWTGNFEDLAHPPLSLGDRLVSWYRGKPWWWLRPWGRRLCRWRKKLLPARLRCRR
ncbi:hypothetical protein PLESTB_001364800 [Pleodorina starrii]|uniref:Uncharacterized protein n=1 Tax=Pleodorina starrii TaxID=330485 RepID=A0A9W6F7F2_9CHLO|nr:hypothetical protein PLESTM_000420200 [Pleodorina starrii]GLC58471.1 hypothetical protein PLESTB_001364800 [Pleodorina starrii]GLC74129.1 hypothetical protein PLESTF_001465000 [Pleodorina starrii]